jgi:large conductance mechanosensitive channel
MRNLSENDNFDIQFNFVRFIKFLQDNNIVAVAIASVLSDRINEVTSSIVSHLIMPIINRDGDKDGTKDIKKLEDKIIKIGGIKFEIGKFIVSVVKFIIVTYIIFILASALSKYVKK